MDSKASQDRHCEQGAEQEGERSERDFTSAMGASATQKRSLRNATPDCAATAVEEYGIGGIGESRRDQAVAILEKSESDSDRERRLRGRKAEMGTSARTGRAKALRKQLGERSERDFASAVGATATQKRSLRNVRPTAAATAVEEYGCGGAGEKRRRR